MRRADLVADCARCAAVCCIATSFEASEDFACSKPAGTRCAHLTREARCGIYAERSARGFGGCAQFDCYGAGVRATRSFADQRERDDAFLILLAVHELLFLMTEALPLCPASQPELHARITSAIAALDTFDAASLASVRAFDVAAHDTRVRGLLRDLGRALGGTRARLQLPIAR